MRNDGMPAAQQSSMQQFVGKWQILSAGGELHLSGLRNGEMLLRIDEPRRSDLLRRCGLHELRTAAVVQFRFKVAKSFADGRVYIALLDKNNALHTWNTSSGTNTIRRGQNSDETMCYLCNKLNEPGQKTKSISYADVVDLWVRKLPWSVHPSFGITYRRNIRENLLENIY